LLQSIEGLSDPDKFLKVPLRGTFKNLSGAYISAKRCSYTIIIIKSLHRSNILVDVTEIARQTQILSQRLSIAQDYL